MNLNKHNLQSTPQLYLTGHLNSDKTKVIWIGRILFSKDKLNTSFKLFWGESALDLVGLTFIVDLDQMLFINYNKYYNHSLDVIKTWNRRFLTPFGKVTVVKNFYF